MHNGIILVQKQIYKLFISEDASKKVKLSILWKFLILATVSLHLRYVPSK